MRVLTTSHRTTTAARCDSALRHASRPNGAKITHILLAGYDTNLCMIDKPCGSRSLSTQMAGEAAVILVRDATRPGPTPFANTFATWTAFVQVSKCNFCGHIGSCLEILRACYVFFDWLSSIMNAIRLVFVTAFF